MNYRIEVQDPRGQWVTSLQDNSKLYCLGYLHCYRSSPGPRLAMRVVRAKDGRVVDDGRAYEDVSLGAAAGFPSAEQYEAAAERALEQARIIREREARRAERERR